MTTIQRIIDSLRNAGVHPGDALFVHSSLRAVGAIESGPAGLLDALLECVGSAGVLAMPAFNYTRPPPLPFFDSATTASRTGALCEMFRKHPGVARSLHPTHSILACGGRASEFVHDHLNCEAFGINSPIDRIAQAGGLTLLIGVSHTSNSCIHIGEAHAGIRKFGWSDEPPTFKLRRPDGSVIEHRGDFSSSCSRAFNAVDLPLRIKGQVIDLSLGDALCTLMRSRDIINCVIQLHREHPGILFCRMPTCRPCALGRQYLEKTA